MSIKEEVIRLNPCMNILLPIPQEYARDFVRKIVELATAIPDFPLLGRTVPEFKNDHIRERIYKNYRIIYRIAGELIEIVTIFHNARQLNEGDL